MMQISMSSPDITMSEIDAINAILRSPSLSIGPQIQSFEQAVAGFSGAGYGVGVNSGTSGLHLCVIGAGIEQGDMVITSPFSFVASANCILYERGIPIFVDVDEATGNIDPSLLGAAVCDLVAGGARAKRWLPPMLRDSLVSTGRLKALLPVHAFGQPADMDPILDVARRYDLVVLEDACEAIGAEYKGRKVGTFSDSAVFGFYPNKQLTTGEGGMIVTNDLQLANLYRSLRNQGRDVFDAWLSHTRLGYNYRLDEMSAGLGVVQLSRIEELLTKRDQVSSWYNERLEGVELIERPSISATTTRMSWFVYVIRIMPPNTRDEVMYALAEAGIPSRAYFNPIHLQPFFRRQFGYEPGDFPITERLGDISLALPFSGVMTEDQVDQVCSVLRHVLERQIAKIV